MECGETSDILNSHVTQHVDITGGNAHLSRTIIGIQGNVARILHGYGSVAVDQVTDVGNGLNVAHNVASDLYVTTVDVAHYTE